MTFELFGVEAHYGTHFEKKRENRWPRSKIFKSFIGDNDSHRLRIVGTKVDGYETVSINREALSRNTNRVDVITVSPTGKDLFWDFEETIPHKFNFPSLKSAQGKK